MLMYRNAFHTSVIFIHFANKTTIDFCSLCCLGKAHQLHAPSSTTVYHTPLELIFSDLWGPASFKSTSDFSYYVTFFDAFTRFTWIYLLKTNQKP